MRGSVILLPALLAWWGIAFLDRALAASFGGDAVDRGNTDRQSQIIELLTGQSRPVSVPKVARQLGVSERTIHRDVEALRQMAVEIVTEPGRSGGLMLKSPVAPLADAGQPASPDSPIGSRPAVARSPGDEFVGRGPESDQLDQILDEAIGGDGRIVMVVGEPGIGKTRLIQALASRAVARGAVAEWGRCRDIQGAPPYWPWTQAIRALIDDRGSDFTAGLPPANSRAIAAAIPELARFVSDSAPDTVGAGDSSQFLLFDSFNRLLKAAAADSPLLVMLDDLHWADEATLGLLEFVSDEVDSTRIMVVGTARTIDPTVRGRLASSLAELSRKPGFSRVELGGLSRYEVGQLINPESSGEAGGSLADEVFTATEGNPFFTIEMSRLYASEANEGEISGPARTALPDAVRDVIERRLSGLSEECVRVLNIGSVLGYRFEYGKLSEVSDPDLEGDPLDMMDEALEARVVSEVAGPQLSYEFGHALIHRFLYDSMPTGRRLRLHARVAEELERSHGDNAAAHAAELATHFNEAKSLLGVEKAVRYSRLAAEHAMTAYAPTEAIAHFERAIAAIEGNPDTVENGDLYFGLGNAWNQLRRPFEVVEALTRAFDIYEAEGETAKCIQVASTGIVRGSSGAPAQAAVCERGLALVEPDSLEAAKILNEYGTALAANGDSEGCREALTKAIEIARRQEDLFLEAHALANLANFVLFPNNRFAEAIATGLEVLELGSQLDDPQFLIELGHRILLSSFYTLGEFEEARPHMEALIEHDVSLPGTWQADGLYAHYCQAALAQGKWDEARRISIRRLADHPNAPEFGLDAHIEFMTGSEEAAVAVLSRFVRDRASPDAEDIAWYASMLAVAGLMLEDSEAVATAAEAANADFGNPYGMTWLDEPARLVRAFCDLARRDSEAAALTYDAYKKYRQTWFNAGGFIGADRALALAASIANRPDAAALHFNEGIAFCSKAGLRPELAWTYHDFVSFQLEQGGRIDRSAALDMVDEGLTITDDLGMAPLQQRLGKLRETVLATGTKPEYPDGLTRREVEVLRLVAMGRINREIADELVITENTAAKHVANILLKTACANRAEAATYANVHGLVRASTTDAGS